MNREIDVFPDEVIYRRTNPGQRALVFSADSLPVPARRFLAMVNGHTPLRSLLDLGFPTDDMRSSIHLLVEQGLIEARSLLRTGVWGETATSAIVMELPLIPRLSRRPKCPTANKVKLDLMP
ncbi:hypothetical protein OOT46_08945 [Aquabacterium sp. A7-Y]|uniref:hypothetical protein n=1 Tax=Aquabacterium sp. A7-Y TaxID=1349605 RepID=UPI00223D4B1F|nr:hypothetical protein [Aquabacterium sp. A7-Y]MCW7537975.1 hypothetical protein [Aquabacterium sp. A7-Y]